jgi:hypothetical protein
MGERRLMPIQVRGADGREIAENLGDDDAADLARNVHAASGETVTLIPFVEFDGVYSLDESKSYTFPAAVGTEPDAPDEEPAETPKPKRARSKTTVK